MGGRVTTILPRMLVNEQAQPQLYRFLRHHPELIEVFHNIAADRPLHTGVLLAQSGEPEIVQLYIENLHLPLLLQHEAVKASQKSKCGYEALYSGLEFSGHDSVSAAQVAADRALALSKVASLKDNSQNSLYCYYHGLGESVRASESLLEAIRELILKHAETPGAAEPGQENTAFDLVISGRITRHDKA
ncbi:MAG: hypothetical protein RI932_2347 [Pseudomonadota bacterium]|jgi:hypothetical protein